ncbi:oxidoreductase [Paenibacillus sp. J31TS4]|uniref:oxidoreductase n=1 Tax=Paenibacillus sp. J31TS4 TaxID=2807195 RepID=UPI001B1CFEDF|nr:oxidoreductase [Paenibacillus sp. J31TS4]GIP40018.1 oxidoreductase [Paenibacillus sp. J31TS4]
MPASRQALLLGASGLVGRQLLEQLLHDPAYTAVVILVRRPLGLSHPKLTERIVSFDRLSEATDAFRTDTVFCCLGTTIKQAGSQEAFDRVDRLYPLEAGQLALAAGVRRFVIVTAMGADTRSRFFYSRVKGRLEEELGALGFPSLHLIRPSLLLGQREEFRTGERAAAAVSRALPFVWKGPLAKYRPVPANVVGAAMRAAALLEAEGVQVHESDALFRLAGSLRG